MCLRSKMTDEERETYLAELPDVIEVHKCVNTKSYSNEWYAEWVREGEFKRRPFHSGLNKAVREKIGWANKGYPEYISGFHAYRRNSKSTLRVNIICYIRKGWITDVGMSKHGHRVFVCKKMVFPKYPKKVANRNHKALRSN